MGGDHELIVNEVYALYYFHLYHKAHISCLWWAYKKISIAKICKTLKFIVFNTDIYL